MTGNSILTLFLESHVMIVGDSKVRVTRHPRVREVGSHDTIVEEADGFLFSFS